MSVYALTPLAKADLFDIWSYIAQDSEDAADIVELAIYDACEFAAEAPMRGHSRPDLTTRSLRFWTLTRYPRLITRLCTGQKPRRFRLSPFCTGKEMYGAS